MSVITSVFLYLSLLNALTLTTSLKNCRMFRAFGHDKVWVLDGGLPNWKANNYPVESDGSQVQSGQEAVSAVHKVYAGEKVSYVILFIQICFSRALPLLNLSYK